MESLNTDSTCKLHFGNRPFKLVRASKQYLYNDLGIEFLDCNNSTAHVGHCHPHVVAAGQSQMSVLWTAPGFSNDSYPKYLKCLLEYLPDKLSVIHLVSSGSEANDLALSLARKHTKRQDVAVFESGYHGSLSALNDISEKTFRQLPQGKKDFVHIIPLPTDSPCGESSYNQDPTKHVEKAKKVIKQAQAKGRPIGTFISEIVVTAAGVVIPSKGYYQELYKTIREQGGVCIADEVQTGMGRTGDNFWAFQAYGVIPDILTVGKPIGNGYPLAAVITTKEIGDSMGDYLSTYGGNPIACAIGKAVIEVIANEKLVSSCKMVGMFLLQELNELKLKYISIGAVRGMGLLIGVELVCGRPNLKPATQLASQFLIRMREERIILAVQGIERNVVLITPPLCFTLENARTLITVFDKVLCRLEEEPALPTTTTSSILGISNIPTDVLMLSTPGEENEDEPVAKRQRCYEEMD